MFFLTLPITLLLQHLGLVYTKYFLFAVVNVLALTRMSAAWHRHIVLGERADAADRRWGKGEWKLLALLVVLIAAATGLAYATSRVPILIYFSLNGGADSVFYVSLFLALAAMWGPVLYLASTFALSFPRAAVAGTYDLWRMRRARRVSAWPLMSVLFLLAVFMVLTGALLAVAVSDISLASIALGGLGILLCVALVAVATAMCAVAYRELAADAGGGFGDR